MFDANSRYAKLPNATHKTKDADGNERILIYKRRRLLPAPGGGSTVLEHKVVDGDRLDNLTARYLGDPLLFWHLCDANGVMHPDELTEEAGATIAIALPGL